MRKEKCKMTTTDAIIIIFSIIAGILAYISLFEFADATIRDADERHSKRIAKCINKGNLYKAVSLYKKYNPVFFVIKFVKESAADNFEIFIRTLYIYIKNESSTANVVTQSNLLDFIESITGINVWKLCQFFQEDENFRAYFQGKIDIMKISDDVLDNEKWQAESSNISICLFILALENTGFLKIKDGKKIDFRSLAIQRYNEYCNMPAYKELYNIMDDCEVKDIITKVLNYKRNEEE